MVVRAYHDGSGKEDNPSAKFMTLAGFCATAKVWEVFEDQFRETLIRLGAPKYSDYHPYIHMSEAMDSSATDGYAKWPMDKFSELVMSLLALIPAEIEFFACTVDLNDFRKVKSKLHRQVKNAATVCAEWCFTRIQIPKGDEDLEPPVAVEMYYDRNETFIRAIHKHWCVSDSKKLGWKRELAVLAVANSNLVLPMQLADMAAWILNRHFSIGDRENWRLSLDFATVHNCARVKYDYKSLLADFGPNGRLAPPRGESIMP